MRAGHAGCEHENKITPKQGSMCLPERGIEGDAVDVIRDACGQEEMLEDTDSATSVGCRQFREALSE